MSLHTCRMLAVTREGVWIAWWWREADGELVISTPKGAYPTSSGDVPGTYTQYPFAVWVSQLGQVYSLEPDWVAGASSQAAIARRDLHLPLTPRRDADGEVLPDSAHATPVAWWHPPDPTDAIIAIAGADGATTEDARVWAFFVREIAPTVYRAYWVELHPLTLDLIDGPHLLTFGIESDPRWVYATTDAQGGYYGEGRVAYGGDDESGPTFLYAGTDPSTWGTPFVPDVLFRFRLEPEDVGTHIETLADLTLGQTLIFRASPSLIVLYAAGSDGGDLLQHLQIVTE